MREYKVEFVKIDKHFASVRVCAGSRKEALALARSMQEEDYEETESVQAKEWIVRKTWSIWNIFGVKE